MELGELWEEYGLVGDVMVCIDRIIIASLLI
jgi:hypothetical protein